MGRGICWRAKGQKGRADVLTNKWPCDCCCIDYGIPKHCPPPPPIVCSILIIVPTNVVGLEGISLGP
jgi:hypothetical protein